jgi:hypothetical protein
MDADTVHANVFAANAWEEEDDEVVVIACRSPNLDLETISVYDKIKAEAFVHDL